METTLEPRRIPQTDSIQELAEFWDSHDLTDFEDELVEVAEPVFERDSVLTLRLPASQLEAVQSLAASRGIDSVDLIREWIQEHLNAA